MRSPLLWGLGFSLIFHAVLAPLFGLWKPSHVETVSAKDVIISEVPVAVETQAPTPTPRPTVRPLPAKARGGGGRGYFYGSKRSDIGAPLKLHVVRTTSNVSGQPSELRYIAPKVGSEEGVPGGVPGGRGKYSPYGDESATGTGPPGPAGVAAPSPQPPSTATPTALPTPTCAIPYADARVTHTVKPIYPAAAELAHAYGTVLVLVTLSNTGAVEKTSIYRSAGNRALDLAAMNAAAQSEYAPDIIDCRPVGGTYLFRFIFEPGGATTND